MAMGFSPQTESGTPTTAASSTKSAMAIRFSNNTVGTISEPLRITSFRRSAMMTKPSSSTLAMSPV